MAKTVVGIFNDFTEAMTSLTDFVHGGIPKEHLSIVTPDTDKEFAQYLGTSEEQRIAKDTGIGAVIGGLSGLLVGLGALTIPGVGPVLAAGLVGTMLGAETGSLAGALHGLGIGEYEARSHATKVGEGRTLVIVKTEDSQIDRVRTILQQHKAVGIEQH